MEFSRENLNEFIEEMLDNKEINISDIPCVDLYMDQVTSFFGNKLETVKRNKEDKILTKTMINNYTKEKILMSTKNKKYTRQHLVLLIFIYNLKQVLSIDDIACLFSSMFSYYEEINESEVIDNLYSCFLELKKMEKDKFRDLVNDKIERIKEISSSLNIEKKDKAEMFLTVLTLINSANMQKRTAEKIIDTYFCKESKGKNK